MKIKKLIILIAVLSFFGINVCAEKINIEKLNFDLGMQSLKQNDLNEAVKYFNLVIDKNPKNVEAHYNLAVTYKKLNQNEKALVHFNTVVNLLNSPQEVESDLANIAKLRKQSDENFDVYNQVKSKENDYIDLGDMHADNAQHKAAIEYYNLALKINPYNDNTYFKVSKCYTALKDYNNAEPYIRRALELDTSNSSYKYYQKIVLKNVDSNRKIVVQNFNENDPLKEFEDKYYDKDLYQDAFSQKASTEKTLVTQYYEDNDKKEILQKLSQQEYKDFSYKQSQELDYLDLGDLHFDNQEYDAAIEYYDLALNINPSNDYTHYKLSRCYIETGQHQKADQYIEKALSLSGKNSKYVYFKNRINDRISGKPFEEKPTEYSGESSFYENEIASEPPPEVLQKKQTFFEKMKSGISSIRMPDINFKMPNMLGAKMPKLEGKVEKAEKAPEQEDSTFNRDPKHYEITEKPPSQVPRQLGEPEPQKTQYTPDGYNEKGIEFFKANNLQKAEDYFKKAVQLRPMDPKGYNNLANIEFKRGDYLKAKEYALKSVEVDPQFPEGYYNLALISKKQKDFENEILYLNKAITVAPKYYQAYFARGLAYYAKGDNEKAKYNLSQVLNLRNDHYLASQNLGIVYANELNYTQAEKYLTQAVRLNRNNPQSYFYLGFVQQNSGKTIDSIENLQRSIQLNPTNYKAYVTLSKSYENNAQPEHALETLRNAAEKTPENAEIYNYLGLMSLKFEKYDDACLAFQKAVQKNPKRPIYFYNLSQCYLCLGKRKESNLAFQRGVSIIPLTVQDYIDLAEIFFDRGMTAYAIETLKTGTAQLPNSDYLYLVMSDFYERTGAKKVARDVLQEYLNKKNLEESTFSLLVRKRLSELQ
ncbi:MAG: hypothetical protein A2Y25_01975 [Candidatus Melainabacteria bacterium GWF2_37_15]|nr:MAG: hypothetical protein A2Y25_01975 [Candidatus Melainabacteria bacterium GWF2_37_15]